MNSKEMKKILSLFNKQRRVISTTSWQSLAFFTHSEFFCNPSNGTFLHQLQGLLNDTIGFSCCTALMFSTLPGSI
ncbi:hypothetical protein Pint_20890 [Pistacia integerrima]|uniref:Uncharacterized protein n=1 Tax=Pistacia integerrima TaxID=434235 RepID=A0ACC0X823_9ROSI|nr:hypothetical protein Pint_20890 [Pistacia integerrima]